MKIEDLPEDFTTEILSRLPVESLIRCRCVCKSWHVLLKNPNFVAKHLTFQHQSGRDNKHVFLKRFASYGVDDDSMCILSAYNVDDPQIVDLPGTFQLTGSGLDLIGHCDGLIALTNSEDGIIVVNPATREFKILPDSSFGPIPYIDVVTNEDDHDRICRYTADNSFLGFGYDSKTDDYKLVRVVSFYSHEPNAYEQVHRVEVFCIRTGSSWRELDVVLESSLAGLLGDHVLKEPYFEGACYWWAEDDETDKNFLLSFHLADEIFVKIPVPALGSTKYWADSVRMGVYKNSIALYIYPDGVNDQIDIWVMEEFGVEAWSKQLTVKLPVGGYCHLGFWNGTDTEFLYADRDGELAICDRFTMETTGLSLPGIGGIWSGVPYMKTIVSLCPH